MKTVTRANQMPAVSSLIPQEEAKPRRCHPWKAPAFYTSQIPQQPELKALSRNSAVFGKLRVCFLPLPFLQAERKSVNKPRGCSLPFWIKSVCGKKWLWLFLPRALAAKGAGRRSGGCPALGEKLFVPLVSRERGFCHRREGLWRQKDEVMVLHACHEFQSDCGNPIPCSAASLPLLVEPQVQKLGRSCFSLALTDVAV